MTITLNELYKDLADHVTVEGYYAALGGSGNAVAGWNTRVLNTLRVAEAKAQPSWISLSSNQFTLQPGVYYIKCKTGFYYVLDSKTNLETSTGTVVARSCNGFSGTGSTNVGDTYNRIDHILKVSSTETYQIEQYVDVGNTGDGWGRVINPISGQRYASVDIWRISW
jgi:hypothetical protein